MSTKFFKVVVIIEVDGHQLANEVIVKAATQASADKKAIKLVKSKATYTIHNDWEVTPKTIPGTMLVLPEPIDEPTEEPL